MKRLLANEPEAVGATPEGGIASVVFQRKFYRYVIPGLTRNPEMPLIPPPAGLDSCLRRELSRTLSQE
jgi:hypothetical protein